MSKLALFLAIVALATGGSIRPELEEILAAARPDETVDVVVQTRLQADPERLEAATGYDSKIQYLKSVAGHAQRDILAWLETTDAANVRPFWVTSRVALSARPGLVRELAARPDVDFVIDDFIVTLDVGEPAPVASTDAIEWNISRVMAPECWADGYDGTGIVVGNIDTGVLVTHEALDGRWRSEDGWFDGVNGQSAPYDDNNHGTHCMGTAVGDSGIGVAPGATFIAAKGFDNNGSGQQSWIEACINWMAGTGRPDVLSNSWGGARTNTYWFAPFNTLRSLGIIVVVSIGNSGPNAATSNAPGNYPISIGVGATTSTDAIAGFSSRGPAPDLDPWNDEDYWPRPDWDLLNPGISAPGQNIRSALPNGGYGSMNGTSMACPHVAGAAAILLQRVPGLTHDELFNLFADYADRPDAGGPYPNNNFGWGILNIKTALDNTVELPSAPVAQSPPNGADVASLTPTLQVGPVAEAIQYNFRVFSGTDEIRNVLVSAGSWTVSPPLDNGADYTWDCRVQGDNGWGPYFAPRWSFNVRVAPGGFALVQPPDGANSVPLDAALTWNPSSGAEVYRVYLDTLAPPATMVGVVYPPVTQFPFETFVEHDRTYHWQVVAMNVGGETRSAVRQFRTEPVPPPFPGGWTEVRSVPGATGNSRDVVRRGSFLVAGPAGGSDNRVIYATKGNKLQNFFRYSPEVNNWLELAPVPVAGGRSMERGCRGVYDGDNTIYVVYGNNTLAFLAYDIAANTWSELADVPAEPSGRRVRGGGDAAWVEIVGDGYVYLLKGDRKDFARYNVNTGEWEQRSVAPGLRYRRDSWLVAGPDGLLYLHQARDHGFWTYDPPVDVWSDLKPGMPQIGNHGGNPRMKRARDGSSAAFGADGRIYALKGGNTTMFYSYDPVAERWAELPGLPREGSHPKLRRVNAGGALVHYGEKVFFALKGNKTNEFWRFDGPDDAPPQALGPERSGAQAGAAAGRSFVRLGPNPLAGGLATLRYSLPQAGTGRVLVFDAVGRTVLERALPVGRGESSAALDLRGLGAGVYLVKVEAGAYSATQKLVVQR